MLRFGNCSNFSDFQRPVQGATDRSSGSANVNFLFLQDSWIKKLFRPLFSIKVWLNSRSGAFWMLQASRKIVSEWRVHFNKEIIHRQAISRSGRLKRVLKHWLRRTRAGGDRYASIRWISLKCFVAKNVVFLLGCFKWLQMASSSAWVLAS